MTPAARLLAAAASSAEMRLETHLVIHVANADIADGLLQWPETRNLIQNRLGPTALVVAEADVPKLKAALSTIQQNIGSNSGK